MGFPITLRDAVLAANNTPGLDRINFAPALANQTIRPWGIEDLTFGQSAMRLSDAVVIDGACAGPDDLARPDARTHAAAALTIGSKKGVSGSNSAPARFQKDSV